MSSPEILFARAFSNITSRFAIVSSLRQVANYGAPAATPKVNAQTEAFARQLFHDPQYASMFLDKNAAFQALGGVEGMGRKLADNQLSNFKVAVDAASLVFAHSIVDSAALDFLRITAAHSHLAWVPFVERKQILIASLNGRCYDDVIRDTVAQYVDSLDRQSLLIKVDRLFSVCCPEPNFDPMDDYTFDRERLVRLDSLRHDVVHGAGPVTVMVDCDDDVWYLQKTAFYFMGLVNMRYDTRIDTTQFLQPKPARPCSE